MVTKLTIQRSKTEHKEEAKAEEEEMADEQPVPLVTHVNNILHSIFSNVEAYINSQQIYNSNGLYAHKSYISNNFKGAISEYKGVLHCGGYDYEEFLDEFMEAPLPEPFSTRRMKKLSRPDGFTRMIITRNDSTCLLTLLWRSTIWKLFKRFSSFLPDKSSILKKNILDNAPVRRFAVAMNTNSAFTGFYTENPFWYQQFDLRQIRILRGGQSIVDFDAADNCRLYVTTMEAMNFQEDIPSIPIDNFKDHYVLVFDLTSMQDATENFHYPELVGEPLRREVNFTFPLEQVTKLIVLGERMSSVAVDKFGVVGKNFKWVMFLSSK